MGNPYPIPRETRQSPIIVETVAQPMALSLFASGTTADIEADVSRAGGIYAPEAVIVTKVNSGVFDFFLVTFTPALRAADRAIVNFSSSAGTPQRRNARLVRLGDRAGARAVGDRDGASELRRDVNRGSGAAMSADDLLQAVQRAEAAARRAEEVVAGVPTLTQVQAAVKRVEDAASRAEAVALGDVNFVTIFEGALNG